MDWLNRRQQNALAEKETLLGEWESVNARNLTVLRLVSLGAMAVFSASLLLALLSRQVSDAGYLSFRLAYLALVAFFAVVYLLLRLRPRQNSLPLVYVVYAVAVFYCAVTSALLAPDFVSVTILAVLFQLPILYLDKSWRINVFVLLAALGYLLAIRPFKSPVLFVDEAINAAMFASISLLIGQFTRKSQLENFSMKAELHARAYEDQLTGLPNRRKLFEDFDVLADSPATGLAILDIDDFKRYNDTYGHQAGDVCLRTVASLLLESREDGTADCYRYGGEEFVVLFRGCSRQEMQDALLTALQRVENAALPHSGSRLGKVTVSIGFAPWEPPSQSYAQVLSQADQALYEAKAQGKNRLATHAIPHAGVS